MLSYAAISASSSGDNTIVAAVSGRRIYVHNYLLIATADVIVTWKSGATSISGPMSIAAQGGVSADGVGPSNTWLRTAAGEALILSLSGAFQVSGHIQYTV